MEQICYPAISIKLIIWEKLRKGVNMNILHIVNRHVNWRLMASSTFMFIILTNQGPKNISPLTKIDLSIAPLDGCYIFPFFQWFILELLCWLNIYLRLTHISSHSGHSIMPSCLSSHRDVSPSGQNLLLFCSLLTTSFREASVPVSPLSFLFRVYLALHTHLIASSSMFAFLHTR